jgi:hypothetical protein
MKKSKTTLSDKVKNMLHRIDDCDAISLFDRKNIATYLRNMSPPPLSVIHTLQGGMVTESEFQAATAMLRSLNRDLDNAGSYIPEEPTIVERYIDRSGELFDSKEEALASTFNRDLEDALDRQLFRDDDHVTFIRDFVKDNPDMVRILLGDRELC